MSLVALSVQHGATRLSGEPNGTTGAEAVPFSVGERLTYDASYGRVHVGQAYSEVSGIDTVNARPAWRAMFVLNGGTFFFKVRDSTVSWFDTHTLASLHFVQHIREGRYEADRDYRIYPKRTVYIQSGQPEAASVPEPLDDASFLYFLRTIPLEVGQQYTFDRYFRPEGNPIVIHVLRRERITVPAGTFDAIAIQPQIATRGVFSEKGHAEVWLADDSTRIILQIKSRVRFGSLSFYLTGYTPGRGAAPAPTVRPTPLAAR